MEATYSGSAAGVMITLDRAHRVLRRHGWTATGGGTDGDPDGDAIAEFMAECWNVHSDGEHIDAAHVMDWLGY